MELRQWKGRWIGATCWRASRDLLALPYALAVLVWLVPDCVHATAPILYSQRAYQSPVRADPDDLLFLPGFGMRADDVVVYQALANTTLPLIQPAAIPAVSDANNGVAPLASVADAPYSLTVRLPQVFQKDRSYAIWVRNSLGEWSNGVKINDARPLWLSPSFAYSTAQIGALPRYIKVVGRNLQPAALAVTEIRLSGAGLPTYTLNASNDGDSSTAIEHYAAKANLPATLTPGIYSVAVRRDGTSWVTLTEQTFEVKANPVAKPNFLVSSYGCLPNDGLDDVSCIVAAVNAARVAGGGNVVFGAGVWTIKNDTNPDGFTVPSGVSYANGIVIYPQVNLVGTPGQSIIAREVSWNLHSWFVLLGQNTVSGLTFRDLAPGNTDPADSGLALRLGYRVLQQTVDPPNPASIDDVVITGNRFDKPGSAIGVGGAPLRRIVIVSNTIGAYGLGIAFSTAKNPKYPVDFVDSVIANNVFKPGSYIDPSANQGVGHGVMASTFPASRRVDFSQNIADGAALEFLNSPSDPKGWRAAFFWTLERNNELLLISQNTATCTGDKIGDGEAIAFDGNHNTYGFDQAQRVAAASAGSVRAYGSLQPVNALPPQNPAELLQTYYNGFWIRVVDGPGLGQARKIKTYQIDPSAGTVTFNVEPNWDVQPEGGFSRVIIDEEYWQTYTVDNVVDSRQPLCQKSNRSYPAAGAISVWGSSADSAVEGNRQYDTTGIVLQHNYSAVAPASFTAHSNLEIRRNLIDGEYDWNSPCSVAGLRGNLSASDTPSAPPPVISYGVSFAHNTIRRADGLNSGALEFSEGYLAGPAPYTWQLIANPLIHHNSISDIAGSPPTGTCQGINHTDEERSGIHLQSPLVWRSVLYANTCSNVSRPLLNKGTATVPVCPSGPTGGSCECTGQPGDVRVYVSTDLSQVEQNNQVVFSVTVENAGTATATGVWLTLNTPNFEILPDALFPNCDLAVGACKIGSIFPGGSVTLEFTALAVGSGSRSASFSVTNQAGDNNLANNGANVLVVVTPNPRPVPAVPVVFAALFAGALTLLGKHVALRRPNFH